MPKFPTGPDGRYQFPRLHSAQLRAIYERNPCAEVRELLWEIHRLHILLRRANQLQEASGAGCHTSYLQILETFRAELRGEPCIEERKAWDAEFFGPRRVSEYTRRQKEKE
ncbi:hypothetical protein [Cupriavidus sp. UYPR2.512]|uniref:hypothetical protein n=1 Tax=Cupriavidus sp. UYPR2.512 TaxID=1080187 RepID=UPI000379A2ED|nr:hypothetical protein [Cupriavidus sp. UYPR2.512]UIF90835.1 hypothetical protein KAF44_32110 [Cupriavidus necator]